MSERRIFEVSFPVGHALEKERKPISFALIAHAGLIPLTSKAKKKKKNVSVSPVQRNKYYSFRGVYVLTHRQR